MQPKYVFSSFIRQNWIYESVAWILTGSSDTTDYNKVSAFGCMENKDRLTDRKLYTNLERGDNPAILK